MPEKPDPNEEALRSALAEAERITGPNSFEAAAKLDQLAAYLRQKKKTLDAVNFEARAKKIRANLGIPDSSAGEEQETWGARERAQITRDTAIILAALFAFSLILREAGNFIPFSRSLGYLCSAGGWAVLNQSGHPFDTPPVKIGAVVVWIALLALVPGMPTSQPASSNQGWNLLQQHKYKDAHAVFDRLVKANTHSIDGWLGRACASAGLGKDEDAVQDCNNAENIIVGSGSADLRYSDGPNVYLERAICYYKLGQYEKTVGDVSTVAQYDTNPQRKGMALYISSEALAKLGRTDESVAYRKIARELGVNDPSISGISIAAYRQ